MSVTLGSLWWEWRTGLVTWWDYGLGETPSVRVSGTQSGIEFACGVRIPVVFGIKRALHVNSSVSVFMCVCVCA